MSVNHIYMYTNLRDKCSNTMSHCIWKKAIFEVNRSKLLENQEYVNLEMKISAGRYVLLFPRISVLLYISCIENCSTATSRNRARKVKVPTEQNAAFECSICRTAARCGYLPGEVTRKSWSRCYGERKWKGNRQRDKERERTRDQHGIRFNLIPYGNETVNSIKLAY